MVEVDLSYLDQFAGEAVTIEERLDPNYNRNSNEKILKGRLMPGTKWPAISFINGIHTPEHESGKIVKVFLGEGVYSAQWSTKPHTGPGSRTYLGVTQTVWKINRISDNVPLFSHKKIGKNEYEIKGLDQKVMGLIRNLKFPYETPYECWEALSGDENMKEFLNWRDNLIFLSSGS